MGEGASRQDHSSLASLSLFHTSEMLQHFTNGIHLLIHTALGQQKDKIQKDTNTKRLKKGQKREAKRKKNWTYSTTDSCCCCTRDWTDRRANELASRWHTVHSVVMGQGSGIRTKTLLEDWRWFALNLPWIILRPCIASLSSSLLSTKGPRPLLAPGCPCPHRQ